MSGLGITGGVVRPLTHDAVFRIEVSLSSRRSSAIVMRTTARLYSLEGSQEVQGGAGDVEWKSVAYGAPCIQLTKETTEYNSPFTIKIVIAEVESGISLWESPIEKASGYHIMQNNFHTFKANGKTYAIQFASEEEAGRMLESLEDLLLQMEKAQTVSFDKKSDDSIFKKPKPFSRRLSKKEISAPCNFKHVSGITLQRTQTCEEELRGTIQRKMRSMSMGSLTQRKVKPRTRLPSDVDNGPVYTNQDSPIIRGSPDVARREKDKAGEGKKGSSMLHKFSSLRKKKGEKHVGGVTVTILDYPAGAEDGFARTEHRRSLPSHFRHHTRAPLGPDTFVPMQQPPQKESQPPNRGLSLSSGDLADMPTSSEDARKPNPLERRHTVHDHTNRQRPLTQYSYTPYSVAQAQAVPEGAQLGNRQYLSDMSLNRVHTGRVDAEAARRLQATMDTDGMVGGERRQAQDRRQLRRGSLTEAQMDGRVNWQERGVVTGGGAPYGRGVVTQQGPRPLTSSRSTGNIHDSSVPPPLPPPNPSAQNGVGPRGAKVATVGPSKPPQHASTAAAYRPPTWRNGSGQPGQGQASPEHGSDPQPYAITGFKIKSKPHAKNSRVPQEVPPSEYDLLTPRQPSSTAAREVGNVHMHQPQPQGKGPQQTRDQGLGHQHQGMVAQPRDQQVQPHSYRQQRPQSYSQQQPLGFAQQPPQVRNQQRPHGASQPRPASMTHFPSTAPMYYPPPQAPPTNSGGDARRYLQEQYSVQPMSSHGVADTRRYTQDHQSHAGLHPGQSRAMTQMDGGPRHLGGQGPYVPHPSKAPYPQTVNGQPHDRHLHPTHPTQTSGVSYPGYTVPSTAYPAQMTTRVSYPDHRTSYPDHRTSYPDQRPAGVLYPDHITNVSYPVRMTTSTYSQHRAPTQVSPSSPSRSATQFHPSPSHGYRGPTRVSPASPSHPSTQINPSPSHGPRQSFQPPPPSGQIPQLSTRSQLPGNAVAGLPGGPEEHYDALLPRSKSGPRADLQGSPAGSDASAASGEQYTEQMSRALEQFDSLLAPQSKRQIMQTSL